jgi:hypothetical protein
MDQAMVLRLLHVIDASGTRIPGKSALEDEESIWLFQPDQPWRPGAYSLAFSKLLEDLAGNRIGRPFDVDVFEPVQKRIVEEVVHLPFQIPAGR